MSLTLSPASHPLRLLLIGGHGRVSLLLTRLAVQRGHTVVSQLRRQSDISDLPTTTTTTTAAAAATTPTDGNLAKGSGSSGGVGKIEPLVKDLEEISLPSLTELLEEQDPNVIVFLAGAGGKGGPERTKRVDQEGAIKVFDALAKSSLKDKEHFRRLVLCSAVDVRDVDKTKPEWYSAEDLDTSRRMRETLGPYMEAKYNADVDLSRRREFPWIVLRPSRLLDDDATEKVSLAERKGISVGVPREDVARTFLEVVELPKGQGDGMMWDLTRGQVEVARAVKEAVERARTDWLG